MLQMSLNDVKCETATGGGDAHCATDRTLKGFTSAGGYHAADLAADLTGPSSEEKNPHR